MNMRSKRRRPDYLGLLKTGNPTAWLTASQAAARLGVSERTIQRRCRAGRVPGARLAITPNGRRWMMVDSALPPPTANDTSDTAAYLVRPFRSAAPDTPATNDRLPPGGAATNDSANDTRLGRLEGYAARDLELVIAGAVERAVTAAQAPLLERIDQLTAEVRGLRESAGKGAQAAPEGGRETRRAPIRPPAPLWLRWLGVRFVPRQPPTVEPATLNRSSSGPVAAP
jgi:hypothetical protein